jgi:hypothetical protein
VGVDGLQVTMVPAAFPEGAEDGVKTVKFSFNASAAQRSRVPV